MKQERHHNHHTFSCTNKSAHAIITNCLRSLDNHMSGNKPALQDPNGCSIDWHSLQAMSQPFEAFVGTHKITHKKSPTFRGSPWSSRNHRRNSPALQDSSWKLQNHPSILPALRGSIWKWRSRLNFLSAMRGSTIHSQNPLNTRMKHSRSFTRIKQLLGLRSRKLT